MFPHLFTKQRPLILASQSPRRKNILEMMNIPFQVVPSNFEEIVDEHLSPEENARLLALGKAQDVFAKYPDSFVLGVDTLVVSAEGTVLGKPKDEHEARAMFQNASGKQEKVISGIALLFPNGKIVRHETAEVFFSELSEEDMDHMIALEEWRDTSGGITIEGKSGIYIDRIEGNLWNIMGLPVVTFRKMIEEIHRER